MEGNIRWFCHVQIIYYFLVFITLFLLQGHRRLSRRQRGCQDPLRADQVRPLQELLRALARKVPGEFNLDLKKKLIFYSYHPILGWDSISRPIATVS
jgi:hypothetical protein